MIHKLKELCQKTEEELFDYLENILKDNKNINISGMIIVQFF